MLLYKTLLNNTPPRPIGRGFFVCFKGQKGGISLKLLYFYDKKYR
ncbi:hypothetical protein [Campylobacter phage CJLB-5]|nr:hypothetical protein [Campylobacter phage CJLB-5]